MSECDYLLWLSYESFRRILFPEGATTIGSEVFQAPILVMQENSLIRKIRLILKSMTSQPG